METCTVRIIRQLSFVVLCAFSFGQFLNTALLFAQSTASKFGARSLADSATPIRPGVPGKAPFWNQYAHQFIYAPAFDYKPITSAAKYRFDLKALDGPGSWSFVAAEPWNPLSPVWTKIPAGEFSLTVTGIDAKGKSVGIAGQGHYYRAAWFNGPYYPAVLPYHESARVALDHLYSEPWVQYWFAHQQPDPSYVLYRYPAKIWGALIVGAVTQAHLHVGTPDEQKYTRLACIIADRLIDVSFPANSPLAYLPPTYRGYPKVFRRENPKIRLDDDLTISAIDGGVAYLDLYDLTHEAKYLDAARRIAQTLLHLQLPNGTWYLYLKFADGKPAYPNLAIPTAMINYFDRLTTQYHVSGLRAASERAVQWTMENPVRTWNWQGQFEDVYGRPPYVDQSREQACDLAIYLLNNHAGHPEYLALARELIRFAEDQFVVWERPKPGLVGGTGNNPGGQPCNWITPSVQEQYLFWMPIGRSAAIMMETYRIAYEQTGDPILLAKATSIANAFTVVQQANGGRYPTFFTTYPMNFWLNSVVYPAKFLMIFENSLHPVNQR